jgi:hypothetical protein
MKAAILDGCPPITVVAKRRHPRYIDNDPGWRRPGYHAKAARHVKVKNKRIIEWPDGG